MKPKLLITGAGGYLGGRVGRCALAGWSVIGLYHTRRPAAEDMVLYPCDLTDFTGLEILFQNIRPQAVIHTAAVASPDYCQTHEALSRRVNLDASVNLAKLCAGQKIPLVFTSTDLVFDGQTPPYDETAVPNPVSRYAKHKFAAEKEILDIHPAACICRMPLLFGFEKQAKRNPDRQLVDNLLQGRPVALFTDEFRTPVDTHSAARGLLWALDNVRGIVHLGGRRRISRFEMGTIYERLLNLPRSIIQPVKQADIALPAPRPGDVSLDSRKAYRAGYAPLDLEAAIQRSVTAMGYA